MVSKTDENNPAIMDCGMYVKYTWYVKQANDPKGYPNCQIKTKS